MEQDIERYWMEETMSLTRRYWHLRRCLYYMTLALDNEQSTHAYMDNITAEIPRINLYTSSIKDFLGAC
ncbi:uncharacterized protein Bfra_006809 [Botrytis fragariae]|uniref:Uncharacterized protein n=1 Tax=Botrytis fragariae TaxID=1964551 RepID=A0A8H6EPC2_9HELO|nr:uncharacterized protein Bfra_006809 [Botrytis fragariae]KAF5879602.1 hypothetical protein Bfra_006809 [Botrytis fragariae]